VGLVKTVRNAVSGETYTVSTVQKFDVWETAIFKGRNPLTMGLGRGLKYMEHTYSWDAGPEVTHDELVRLAEQEAPASWEMTKQDIRDAQELAVTWVNKGPQNFLSLIASNAYRVRKGSAKSPRGHSVPLVIPDPTYRPPGP